MRSYRLLISAIQCLRGEPTAVTRYCVWLMIGGFAMMAGSVFYDVPGILSGFGTAALGSSGAMLSRYRIERGLWMLAGLWFAIYGVIYVEASIATVHDMLRNAIQDSIGVTIDFAVGMALMIGTTRFSLLVAIENYHLSHT